jgi:transaldolase
MSTLVDLYNNCGQSPWLDNIKRSWLQDGTLEGLVQKGVRGVTSNPTIFTNAIESSDLYDDQTFDLHHKGLSTAQTYWELVKSDINSALDILNPVYQASDGNDGFVSIEVSPQLAYDTAKTLQMAKDLHDEINKPNLLVKIPATEQGLKAIEEMIFMGNSVNVTLIFSIERYRQVINAYTTGLERRLHSGVEDLSSVNCVASFFVSRLDTLIDKKLDETGSQDAVALKGKAAVAQAKKAYGLFLESFESDRFSKLRAHKAKLQRPLWASTSTKNPAYDDLLYVDSLIGQNTVNTMPDATINAFLDHGRVVETISDNLDEANSTIESLQDFGIDMESVTQQLEDEGVKSFEKSFEDLLEVLKAKTTL